MMDPPVRRRRRGGRSFTPKILFIVVVVIIVTIISTTVGKIMTPRTVVPPVHALATLVGRRQRLTRRPLEMTTGGRCLLFSTKNDHETTENHEMDDNDGGRTSPTRISVSGLVYDSSSSSPIVTLFTKHGCTLCDQVKDVLQQVRSSHDHSLWQIDITDPEHIEWYHKYKYDIPVVHLGGKYWIKHRLTVDEARQGLEEAATAASTSSSSSGSGFVARPGEPNAAKLERRPRQ